MPEFRKSQGRYLRAGRYSEIGRIYLLTTVVKDRKLAFQNWQLGRLLVGTMKQAEIEGQIKSLAWVIMPDHLHWLVELRAGTLDGVMRRVKSRSTHAINQASGRKGPLWQPGYHDHAVRHEDDLKVLARYVLANPLRAGLVKKLAEYPLWDAIWL